MTASGVKNTVPDHVAIIMDGNGRWAKQKNLPRTAGHKEGLTVAKKILSCAAELGIKFVTLYTFSTENWKRTSEEVGFLMNLIKNHLRSEFEFYKQNSIRIQHIGNFQGLPPDVQKEIQDAIKDTQDFTGLTTVLAINYGGKDEILRAVKNANLVGALSNDALNEKNFSQFFDYPSLPDVDLLIRTGGEKRLSNFLLWQTAYAELDFTDILWPDYTEDDFKNSIVSFQKRNRRFGGINNE